ncbi:sodium:solute symporter family protein [uncultured Thermanaerothrix sp.]|uniref:sodium:solute symporter family protein n=1 Tax=uncultured Thermanaerothrix sp. TaxID=1195149 RepID=UPI0026307FEB|nr:sodium:solute symporter family protein [uncultured Thermanaerothrix sp.]
MNALGLLAAYLAFLLLISGFARRRALQSPEEFFLAGRTLGPVVLFFTLAATNFSAFFFLGFAGAAWKSGLGQYGIMGVGTALVPISFYFIGRKVWRLGKQKGYVTAPQLIGGEFNSSILRQLVLWTMILFTLPYLLTQAVGAGILVSALVGSDLVRVAGAVVMVIIGAVVILGGMRGSAWTDVLQGGIMIVAMAAALIFVARGLGGFTQAGLRAFAAAPEHFMRPGPDGYFSLPTWISFIALWTFVNPLFPQMFTRFYTARSLRSLRLTLWLYPLLVSFLFLAPVLIGVWARGVGLEPPSADAVLPTMVAEFAPGWVHALVMVGALAALMSTADSQLLALATMMSNDLKLLGGGVQAGRWFSAAICGLVAAALLLGFNPQLPIFTFLTQTTFAGLAALTPATLAALYRPTLPPAAPIVSILVGEGAVLAMRLGKLPTFGLADGVVALSIAALTLLVVAGMSRLLQRQPAMRTPETAV